MAQVGIIMGSKSDLPIMKEAIDILTGFDIEFEVDIVSAHRTPERLFDYGKTAHERGLKVIIAGKNLSNLKNILEDKKFKGTIIK